MIIACFAVRLPVKRKIQRLKMYVFTLTEDLIELEGLKINYLLVILPQTHGVLWFLC